MQDNSDDNLDATSFAELARDFWDEKTISSSIGGAPSPTRPLMASSGSTPRPPLKVPSTSSRAWQPYPGKAYRVSSTPIQGMLPPRGGMKVMSWSAGRSSVRVRAEVLKSIERHRAQKDLWRLLYGGDSLSTPSTSKDSTSTESTSSPAKPSMSNRNEGE